MELISREEVKTIIECTTGYHKAIKDAFDRVMELPIIESRPKGEWKKDEYGIPHCSECNCINNTIHRNYCSNCGAEMREGK